MAKAAATSKKICTTVESPWVEDYCVSSIRARSEEAYIIVRLGKSKP